MYLYFLVYKGFQLGSQNTGVRRRFTDIEDQTFARYYTPYSIQNYFKIFYLNKYMCKDYQAKHHDKCPVLVLCTVKNS